MADAVTTQILNDGARNAVVKITNISDGTGESAVTKVDVSTLLNSPDEVKIERVIYSTGGMGLDILWDATADVLAWHLPPDQDGVLDFACVGGIPNNAGSGKTGDINVTTTETSTGDRYSVILELAKRGG